MKHVIPSIKAINDKRETWDVRIGLKTLIMSCPFMCQRLLKNRKPERGGQHICRGYKVYWLVMIIAFQLSTVF